MALQVTFDCADPHAQARFWAVAMGYEVDDHHQMISELLDAGHVPADSDDVEEVDGRPPVEAVRIRAPGRRGRRQPPPVPARRRAEDREEPRHLDIHVPEGERDAHVAKLISLGATKLWDASQGPMSWDTLADPEGNELCVS